MKVYTEGSTWGGDAELQPAQGSGILSQRADFLAYQSRYIIVIQKVVQNIKEKWKKKVLQV